MAVGVEVLLERRARRGRSLWAQAWRRLLRKRMALVTLSLIGILYLSGVFAPWVAPYSYTAQDYSAILQAPSLEHPLGTDRLGRDLLSRLIWGLRTTVIITVMAVATGSIALGILLGGLSGYLGRKVDMVIMRIGEVFLAFPGILLVILIAATVKPRVVEWARAFEQWSGMEGLVRSGAVDYFVVFGALAAFNWVGMARLVRGQFLSLKENQFVEAARAMGASHWRIIFVHLFPNSLGPVIVTLSMSMGTVAGSEVILSWLGIGVQPPNPSLGNMIFENGNISVLRSHPHLLLAPVITVGVIIYAFNLLGDALNDAFNPRAR